jgi:integrase-like protein
MTTPDTGSPLRQRMIEDMVARKLALGTQRGHVFACKQLAAYLGRSPETATPDDVRSFQRHLIDSGRSVHYRYWLSAPVRRQVGLLWVRTSRQSLAASAEELRKLQVWEWRWNTSGLHPTCSGSDPCTSGGPVPKGVVSIRNNGAWRSRHATGRRARTGGDSQIRVSHISP